MKILFFSQCLHGLILYPHRNNDNIKPYSEKVGVQQIYSFGLNTFFIPVESIEVNLFWNMTKMKKKLNVHEDF